MAALKELGLMKCVLKYGGGGIGGGASAGMALSENEEEGISLEGATGVSACIGTPIVVWYEVEHCM
jgi:hypothetical protein